MQKIKGNTYAVKDQLKALGGKWNPAVGCWEVPDDKAEQAWALVGGKPATTTKAAPAAKAQATAKPAAPKTPEEVAARYGVDECRATVAPAHRVGQLRGAPVFFKPSNLIFTVEADLQTREVYPSRRTMSLPGDRYRNEPITEEEATTIEDAVRPIRIAAKAEADERERPTWNVVGHLRGRPVKLESPDFLIWIGPEQNLYLRYDEPRAGLPERITLGGEDLTPEEIEEVRPMIDAKLAVRREKAEAEERERLARKAAFLDECRAKDRWPIDIGEGYGGRPFAVGETFPSGKDGWPGYLTVVEAKQRYYREDGMSFGVGDEQGHIYSCTCRTATPEESAVVRSRIEAKANAKAARTELDRVAQGLRASGERPEGPVIPEGEEVAADAGDSRIYGGGQWFVIGTEWIWFVQNNGRDGDMWDLNNVRTGGAGAIGWRVTSTPELAARIRELAEASGYTKGDA